MIIRGCGCLAAAVALCFVCGCSTPTPPTASSGGSQLRAQLDADMHTCTRQYGYDPATVSGIADDALAPNELEWRQCMYQALTANAKQHPERAQSYQSLIDSDIAMTAAVKQGTMTRSQRRARIEQLIADMHAREVQVSAASAAERQRQTQEFQNNISAIRAMGN
jgi:hypothetical protein